MNLDAQPRSFAQNPASALKSSQLLAFHVHLDEIRRSMLHGKIVESGRFYFDAAVADSGSVRIVGQVEVYGFRRVGNGIWDMSDTILKTVEFHLLLSTAAA